MSSDPEFPADRIGVVVIGRNEGERLKASLGSLHGARHRVYVDSGSTDGSQAAARVLGFDVIELAIPPPFTAARARNAGLDRLLALEPGLAFVQMVDGDCEVAPGWLAAAAAALGGDERLAVVFGRRRERHPEASVYNRLCDIEWDVPIGEARSCGGDALFRVAALLEAGGYAPELIAGEEPDLCLRLRARGWKIRRIDAEMTLHDAAMSRFGQWWKRSQRGGHAFAELAHRHGRRADPLWTRQVRSILGWGLAGLAALLLLGSGLALQRVGLVGAGLSIVALFAAQIARLALKRMRAGEPLGKAWIWAFFAMLCKFPQLQGILQFHGGRLTGARSSLIEYKS